MDPERLISDYLDDLLSPDETATLFQWIRSHPDNARHFARAAFLHRCLRHRLSAMRLLEETTAAPASASGESSPAASSPLPRSRRFTLSMTGRRWWSTAAALLLIASLLAFLAWPRTSPARLVAVENATWAAGTAAPSIGDLLPRRTLALDAGLITLRFDNGNQLLIQGPATFTVADALHLTLDRGTLTAVVAESGRGLTISTPDVQVTDLGTEFGVFATSNATRVAVYNGRVVLSNRSAGAAEQELSAGAAVEISAAGTKPLPFDALPFKRPVPSIARNLDLVDLLAGGDGRGAAFGAGIDAATGKTRQSRAVSIRRGDRRFVSVRDFPILDGTFVPDGRMPVDSAGHLFAFPTTTRISYGLVWAGPNPPWEGSLRIETTFPGDDPNLRDSRVLVMHSNNAITLNLAVIRALHPSAAITGFRARVGNSYRPPTPDTGPVAPLASVHVLVDGVARFERRAFVNIARPFEVACRLSDNDHFLTLATTDGGDSNPCDWVLWMHPELLAQSRGQ